VSPRRRGSRGPTVASRLGTRLRLDRAGSWPRDLRPLHGDWRQYQERSVRDTLANSEMRAWVAEADRKVVAFVAATLHRERLLGEIWMLAVDPDHQERGVGTALTEFATDWLRASGMRVAMVETGGDSGHAPARRV